MERNIIQEHLVNSGINAILLELDDIEAKVNPKEMKNIGKILSDDIKLRIQKMRNTKG